MTINRAKKDKQPGIPRPWELCGKDADEYRQRVYQDVVSSEMKRRADNGRLAPWEELLRWTENDMQFWNYKDDFKDMKLDKIPRFKTPLLHPQLFIWKEGNKWLLIGKLKFTCAKTLLSCQHHMELTLKLGEPSIKLFSQNMTYFMSEFEWKMSPPGSITDITYDGYLYRESSNVESNTPPTSGSFEIFKCSMAIYGCEDNYWGCPRSCSTDSYEEKQQYSRNYSPGQYRRPPPPRHEIHREYQSYRPDHNNSPYHQYPKRRGNSSIDHSVSPRAHVYESNSWDSWDTTGHTSDQKLPEKETIHKRSMSTTPTVTDLPPPFVAMSDDHIKSLKQISSTLQSTLKTTNQVYRAAMDEIPNMETMFALMCNSVQGLATQLVDINKSFHVSGQQLQSRSNALNHAIMTLTEDIDKLQVLARNIRDNDFATGNYFKVLKLLYLCIF